MGNNNRSALLFLCAVVSGTSLWGCTHKSASPSTPMNLSIKFPELPPRLTGNTWLAPFQVGILIEGSGGYTHKESITGDTVLNLTVPVGALRVRASYFGVEIPSTMTAADLCTDKDGNGPLGMYLSSSDQTITVSDNAEVSVTFGTLLAASEFKYGLTLKYADGTAASNATLTYLDGLTQLPFTGPCDLATTHGPRETADPLGRISGKFFGSGDSTISALITHNGGVVPISFPVSTTNVLKNFFAVNLSTKVATLESETADFDSDGTPNSSDSDPFCGPNSYNCSSSGGGTNGGYPSELYLSQRFPSSGASNIEPSNRITFTFNQAVDYSTVSGSITITPNGGTAEACVPNTALATEAPSTVECTNPLLPQNTYTVSIVPDTLKATSGAAASFSASSATFTTGISDPLTPPQLTISAGDSNQSPNVSTSGHVDIEFTKAMDRSTLSNIATLMNTSTGTTLSLNCTYRVQSWGSSASNGMCCNVVGSNGSSTTLLPHTRYLLSVGGSLTAKDRYGNSLVSRNSMEFTTEGAYGDTTTPTLMATFPTSGSTTADADTWLVAFFNEKISAINWPYIELYDSSNNWISMKNCYTLGTGAYCKPATILTPGAMYHAKIGSIKDTEGNAATSTSWSFTVDASAPTTSIPFKAQLIIPDLDGYGSGVPSTIYGLRYGVLLNRSANTTSGNPFINISGGGTPYDFCTGMCTTGSTFDSYMLTRTFRETPTFGSALSITTASGIMDTSSNTLSNTLTASLSIPSVPALNVVRTSPSAEESVSIHAPITIFVNKTVTTPLNTSITIQNVTDATTAVSCPSTPIVGYSDRVYIRCVPGTLVAGKRYRVTLNLAALNGGTNTPSSYSWEFLTWASEFGASVASVSPSAGTYLGGSISNISGEVQFSSAITTTPTIQMCSVETNQTCMTCTPAAPYVDSTTGNTKSTFGCTGAFVSGKMYKITVSTNSPDAPLATSTYSWVVKN